jgi:hypothetical protein
MNTIRDRIPVELLLRQYMDETQEIEVSKVETVIEPKEPVEQRVEPRVEQKVEPRIEPQVEQRVEQKVEPPRIEPPRVETILQPFPEVNEVRQEVREESRPGISFSQQLESYDNGPQYVEEETLKIGDEIPLSVLDFEDLDKSETIDLGIVEL